MESELFASQRIFLQNKIHVAEGAYARATRTVQQRFPSGWSAGIAIAGLLGALPETAIRWWAEQPNGHILLTADDDSYLFSAVVDGKNLSAVACVPMNWLAADEPAALAVALRPLDHLLGCAGAAEGRWLSDGGGVTPHWQQIGAQIARLFPLGYGETEASRLDPHAFLAEGLAQAITDRQSLNTSNPKFERLLGSSLLSPTFWQRHCPQMLRAQPDG